MTRPSNRLGARTQRLEQALLVALNQAPTASVSELAARCGYSRAHFSRLFKKCFGISPGQLLRQGRIEEFSRRLRQGHAVTDAALAAGFASSSRAHQAARDGLGMQPSRLARGAGGETITWASSSSSLGRILVAATPQGLCAILLGDEEEALRLELAQRFPAARLVPAGPEFQHTMEQIIALVDQGTPPENLPLDLRGTLFQHQVWTALRAIPPGETLTYGQLAQKIGRPGAARAVGSACGANPAAVLVPCHRAIAADGGLGGYRWGLERKQTLLQRERRQKEAG